MIAHALSVVVLGEETAECFHDLHHSHAFLVLDLDGWPVMNLKAKHGDCRIGSLFFGGRRVRESNISLVVIDHEVCVLDLGCTFERDEVKGWVYANVIKRDGSFGRDDCIRAEESLVKRAMLDERLDGLAHAHASLEVAVIEVAQDCEPELLGKVDGHDDVSSCDCLRAR